MFPCFSMTERYSHMPNKMKLVKQHLSSIEITCTNSYWKCYFHNYSCIFYLKDAELIGLYFLHLTLAALQNNDLASHLWWIISFFLQKKENWMLDRLFKGHTERWVIVYISFHSSPLHTKLQSSHRNRGGNTCKTDMYACHRNRNFNQPQITKNTARDLTVCTGGKEWSEEYYGKWSDQGLHQNSKHFLLFLLRYPGNSVNLFYKYLTCFKSTVEIHQLKNSMCYQRACRETR